MFNPIEDPVNSLSDEGVEDLAWFILSSFPPEDFEYFMTILSKICLSCEDGCQLICCRLLYIILIIHGII